METYHGHVRTPADAIVLFEACRLGLLPRVQRRLSEKERQNIKSGSVFVWDEREAGMRRWTDGKSWSASRVSGSFLTYREMEGKRGGNNAFAPPVTTMTVGRGGKSPIDGSDSDGLDPDGPDGYRYKPDGLMKQSFSITTATHQKLHLISYYARSHPTSSNLIQPSNDTALKHIRPVKGMYPESTVHEQQNVPVVTRAPMISAMPQANYDRRVGPHFSAPTQSPVAYASWPPSPVSTPPTGVIPQYAQHALPAPTSSASASPMSYNAPAYSQIPQIPPNHSNGGSPRMYHERPALPQLDGLTSQSPMHRGSMGSMGGSPMMMHRSPRASSAQIQQTPPMSLPAPTNMRGSQSSHGQYDDRYSSPANSIHSRSPPRGEGPVYDINPLRDSPSGMDVDRSLDVQDIPNEKLDFREDMRALRVLDKAFAL
ncbi:Gti1/Pac2 family-domain-containing protein [Geopyxis carbonaria]|nr:Gti1/Pac2 family-domain-containing protein [Geopyxis carbonaria]